MGRYIFTECGQRVGDLNLADSAMSAAGLKSGDAGPATKETNDAGRGDDQGERQVEDEDADERGSGQSQHGAIAQRSLADTHHGFQHDGQDRGLQSEELGLDRADIAVKRVDPAQRHDGDGAGQNE